MLQSGHRPNPKRRRRKGRSALQGKTPHQQAERRRKPRPPPALPPEKRTAPRLPPPAEEGTVRLRCPSNRRTLPRRPGGVTKLFPRSPNRSSTTLREAETAPPHRRRLQTPFRRREKRTTVFPPGLTRRSRRRAPRAPLRPREGETVGPGPAPTTDRWIRLLPPEKGATLSPRSLNPATRFLLLLL